RRSHPAEAPPWSCSAACPRRRRLSRPSPATAAARPTAVAGAGAYDRDPEWLSRSLRRRQVGPSRDEFGEILEELTLALGPDESLHRLALVQHHQRRDAHDVVAHRGPRVVVDVALGDAQLPLVLGCELLERRPDRLSSTA